LLTFDQRGPEVTVLLVEDEGALRRLAAILLREEGYTVLEAGSGEEALQLSSQHQGPIHLLITDILMPGIGGLALARCLLGLRPDLKVIYLSAYSEEDLGWQGAREAGAVFVGKPFRIETLLNKVREALL
jgi:CheY-like chemotaxis protein